MSPLLRSDASLDELRRTDGKAELIAGRIFRIMPTGFRPGQIGGRIFRALDDHARETGVGVALPDGVGFVVPQLVSGRRSFSPDAAFFIGPPPGDEMDLVEGPPLLAVEVRSKHDYGPGGEAAAAAKRADYFEAGTQVVWDVDPRAKRILSYRSETPERPAEFLLGDFADAEPALPGWRVSADDLFA